MKLKLGLALILSLLVLRIETRAQQTASTITSAPILTPEPRSAGQLALPQQAPADLRVQLGKSLLISSQEPLQRVSVTDPTIATAVIVSPTQILIHGLKAGS